MALWLHLDDSIIGDGSSVIGIDGTFYPGAWDKSTLDFLRPITEVAQPSGQDIVVTGWHLNGTTQVWDTRPKTAEEVAQEVQAAKDAHNRPILAALDEIDRKAIRPAREGDSARLGALEAQAVTLRAQLQK